jgi:hypothetical protein
MRKTSGTSDHPPCPQPPGAFRGRGFLRRTGTASVPRRHTARGTFTECAPQASAPRAVSSRTRRSVAALADFEMLLRQTRPSQNPIKIAFLFPRESFACPQRRSAPQGHEPCNGRSPPIQTRKAAGFWPSGSWQAF